MDVEEEASETGAQVPGTAAGVDHGEGSVANPPAGGAVGMAGAAPAAHAAHGQSSASVSVAGVGAAVADVAVMQPGALGVHGIAAYASAPAAGAMGGGVGAMGAAAAPEHGVPVAAIAPGAAPAAPPALGNPVFLRARTTTEHISGRRYRVINSESGACYVVTKTLHRAIYGVVKQAYVARRDASGSLVVSQQRAAIKIMRKVRAGDAVCTSHAPHPSRYSLLRRLPRRRHRLSACPHSLPISVRRAMWRRARARTASTSKRTRWSKSQRSSD